MFLQLRIFLGGHFASAIAKSRRDFVHSVQTNEVRVSDDEHFKFPFKMVQTELGNDQPLYTDQGIHIKKTLYFMEIFQAEMPSATMISLQVSI